MSTKTSTRSEIVRNLIDVAGTSGAISRSRYRNSRKRRYASSTVEAHFGSFTKARKAARLSAVVA